MALCMMVGAVRTRHILQPIAQTLIGQPVPVRNGCIFCRPPVDFFEKPSLVFSSKAILHHWGALPIIVITIVGFTLEVLTWIRIGATRDDVWYTKGGAACEVVETRKGYPPPIRKFMVFNQKYETPEGLINALQGNTQGPSYLGGNKSKESGITIGAVAAHAALTAGAMGLAMI